LKRLVISVVGTLALAVASRRSLLVREGAYPTNRHPMYTSLPLLVGGILLKRVSVRAVALALAAAACLVATALLEEPDDVRAFGPEDAAYAQATRRFIPHVV
jgi:protein-S-isoprenylcysteine O-methyltransferase Ste14